MTKTRFTFRKHNSQESLKSAVPQDTIEVIPLRQDALPQTPNNNPQTTQRQDN